MQTPTVGYKLRWKITYGAKDPSGPLDVYFLSFQSCFLVKGGVWEKAEF